MTKPRAGLSIYYTIRAQSQQPAFWSLRWPDPRRWVLCLYPPIPIPGTNLGETGRFEGNYLLSQIAQTMAGTHLRRSSQAPHPNQRLLQIRNDVWRFGFWVVRCCKEKQKGRMFSELTYRIVCICGYQIELSTHCPRLNGSMLFHRITLKST